MPRIALKHMSVSQVRKGTTEEQGEDQGKRQQDAAATARAVEDVVLLESQLEALFVLRDFFDERPTPVDEQIREAWRQLEVARERLAVLISPSRAKTQV